MHRTWIALGALLGGLALGAGAFGAHALRERLGGDALEWWKTAAHYQLVHAVALMVVGVLRERRVSCALTAAGIAFAGGTVLFSGSLFAMALSGVRWLGAITPFGGGGLLVGWGSLLVFALRRPPPPSQT